VKRAAIVTVVVVAVALFVVWIARNTRWEETTLRLPPRGEALTNPFYATQRFAMALGATTGYDRTFVAPSPDAVVVLSSWHWTLDPQRQRAIERWVESGGRLVIDASIVGGESEFERWSGLKRATHMGSTRRGMDSRPPDPCIPVQEEQPPASARMPATAGKVMCELDRPWELTTGGTATWALKSAEGAQAMRVSVARGSVTWINATPFRGTNILNNDNGWLFVAATELRSGDDIHFLSEEDHRSLLALIWLHGGPAVGLGLAAIALVVWRGGVRFGPLAAEPPAARRSLAEQLRGTAQFALRHGGGLSLYAAERRALDEAAIRRVAGYARLAANDRTEALMAVAPIAPDTLAAAIVDPRVCRPQDLRHTLAVLEAARRHLLRNQTKVTHAAD
jgi:hypothetical protein